MPRLRQSFPSWPPAPLSHRRLNPPCGLHCSSTSCLRLHGFTIIIKDTSQLGAHLSGSTPSEPNLNNTTSPSSNGSAIAPTSPNQAKHTTALTHFCYYQHQHQQRQPCLAPPNSPCSAPPFLPRAPLSLSTGPKRPSKRQVKLGVEDPLIYQASNLARNQTQPLPHSPDRRET
jgi:hypothetical protein